MPGLDWGALEAAQLARTPFDHVAIPQVLTRNCAATIPGEFPAIRGPGSFSLDDARPGPALKGLIDDLQSDRFRAQMSRIFNLDLRDRPTSVTLRGQCAGRDGRVHVDSRSKVLSLLIYLNEDWTSQDGWLRLLDHEKGMDSAPVEIPPTLGSLVAFRRSENSWHGHTTYVGQRRALQFNYMTSERASAFGQIRRRLSAFGKRLAA